ncbi:rhamnan synthesis F family protein [Congregibacter sp.]|uniref:rhamnan synthesis F family protein n=1 Tax=Congregibacter sp. TaxID=2744308 RepID=UPI003F6CECFA
MLGINVLVCETFGYDFMSYRLGIEQLFLAAFDELLLCNDSVYGPVYTLRQLF